MIVQSIISARQRAKLRWRTQAKRKLGSGTVWSNCTTTNCFKEVTVGKIKFKRYSQQAIPNIREALRKKTIDEIWREYQRSIARR
jgi:hypothetical protein